MNETDVAIVGGGPAGLAAAIKLRQRGHSVVIVERADAAGGVPRHTDHTGFGLRDLRQVLSGPSYAAYYVAAARAAGVEIRTRTSATDWGATTDLALTGPDGVRILRARAVLLATGCRERSRAARLIPGARPLGVFNTGTIQDLVTLHHQRPGQAAVIVGAEHVSFSAILTLRKGGCAPIAMITEFARDQTYPPLKWLTASRHRVPIITGSRLARILGTRRVEAVEIARLDDGTVHRVPCDTVVLTGDWIPEHELARRGELAIDPATRSPQIDGAMRTSRRGVFAAGNLLHAAEPADIAALSGRHAAAMISAFLRTDTWPTRPAIPVHCQPPLAWISPSTIAPATPLSPRDRFVLRVSRFCDDVGMIATQGARDLWQRRFRRLVPNRSIYASARWLAAVDPDGPPVVFRLTP